MEKSWSDGDERVVDTNRKRKERDEDADLVNLAGGKRSHLVDSTGGRIVFGSVAVHLLIGCYQGWKTILENTERDIKILEELEKGTVHESDMETIQMLLAWLRRCRDCAKKQCKGVFDAIMSPNCLIAFRPSDAGLLIDPLANHGFQGQIDKDAEFLIDLRPIHGFRGQIEVLSSTYMKDEFDTKPSLI